MTSGLITAFSRTWRSLESSRKEWVGVWSSKRTYEVEMCLLALPQQLITLSAERRQQGDRVLSWHDCHRAICTSFAGH